MRCFLLFAFIGLHLQLLAGGNPEYAVQLIPKELLTNANAVVRLHDVSVDIRSAGKYVVKEKLAITILSESADDQASWSEQYSDLQSIDHIEGTLYDAAGNKIRSLKKSEIKDYPVYDGSTFASDYRMKSHAFYHKSYPYTVVYESEVVSSITMFLPVWNPVNAFNTSLQQSRFSISFANDMVVHRKMFNISKEPGVTNDGKKTTWLFELPGQPALVREYATPPYFELLPSVQFTMGEFRMENFTGSFNTWKEYGQFIGRMREGLDELPPDIKTKVRELTASVQSPEEKVNILYDYLQKHSHYISVQIGIGGWRPFPASYVASKGYGDCKALSNYMVALLKEAGIRSYYTLINAGDRRRDILPDFPSPYFNHAICVVPLAKDTIWLECTSQTNPFGYTGSATGNRHALLITEEGGIVVATPRFGKKENKQVYRLSGKLLPDGTLQMHAVNFYQGVSCEVRQYIVNAYSKEEQLKYLRTALEIPSYDISAFKISEERKRLPQVHENYDFQAPHYAQISGKRIFLQPNVLNRWTRKLSTDTARQYMIDLANDLAETDSVEVDIPEGYTLEAAIKPLKLSTPFGNYEVSVALNGNRILYTRQLELNRGRFEAKLYTELAKFYEQLYKSDNSRIVLVKKE
ncbi:MAG: DUF3857 domain-containing protein [Flavihumibacter sp.]